MSKELIFLDRYVLQKDMRIRLPKSILENLNAVKGETMFSIYLEKNKNRLVLEMDGSNSKKEEKRIP